MQIRSIATRYKSPRLVTPNQPLGDTVRVTQLQGMRVASLVIDRLNEEDFRRSIENRLRERQASAAIERLRRLLAPYAGPGRILPERFLTVGTGDLVLSGWEALGESIRRHDREGSPITALSIAFGWPGEEPRPRDAAGHLPPYVETRYFSDAAFPFSESTRDDLLDGYSSFGCSWGDDAEAVDTVLAVEGIDDLHAALADLEEQLLATDNPDEDGLRAGSLGSCLLSALLFQAVSEQIDRHGLPRPLCVTAGSSGVYPYFDAPVVGMPEAARKQVEDWFDEARCGSAPAAPPQPEDIHLGAPAARYSSLLVTGIPRAKKRAVLVLDESPEEAANRVAELRCNGQGPAALPDAGSGEIGADGASLPDPHAASPLMVKKPHGHPAPDAAVAAPLDLPKDKPEPPPALAAAIEADLPEPGPQAATVVTGPDSFDAREWLQRLTPATPEPEPAWSAALADVPALPQEQVPDLTSDRSDERPAVPSANALRTAMTALRSAVALVGTLWRSRKDPPPPPRKRFPPR